MSRSGPRPLMGDRGLHPSSGRLILTSVTPHIFLKVPTRVARPRPAHGSTQLTHGAPYRGGVSTLTSDSPTRGHGSRIVRSA